jgi:hypothetical protein
MSHHPLLLQNQPVSAPLSRFISRGHDVSQAAFDREKADKTPITGIKFAKQPLSTKTVCASNDSDEENTTFGGL